ncbi:MAG: LuxR C-terminal-related transcriptional regulator [Microbacteriaceae bacterium]
MITARQRDQLSNRIQRRCTAPTDTQTFRSEVLRDLRGRIGFDAYVWLLTDPMTWVGVAPHAHVPAFEHLPSLIRYKYLTPVNRWTALAADGICAASLVHATGGQLESSLVWAKVLAEYGVIDVASSVMVDRAGCWGFLDLWRSGASEPFRDDEITALTELMPMLSRALRVRQAATFAGSPPALPRSSGPVVLILNDSLEVQNQTPATDEWLRTLLPSGPGTSAVPASVYNVAAQLLAVEQQVDAHEARARVHLSEGTWLSVRAARMGEQLAVSLEPTSPAERLELFALSHYMTPREALLLGYLADGSDTKSMAKRMFLSELTVQDHLKSIFAKAGVHSRKSLLARILGTHSG